MTEKPVVVKRPFPVKVSQYSGLLHLLKSNYSVCKLIPLQAPEEFTLGKCRDLQWKANHICVCLCL